MRSKLKVARRKKEPARPFALRGARRSRIHRTEHEISTAEKSVSAFPRPRGKTVKFPLAAPDRLSFLSSRAIAIIGASSRALTWSIVTWIIVATRRVSRTQVVVYRRGLYRGITPVCGRVRPCDVRPRIYKPGRRKRVAATPTTPRRIYLLFRWIAFVHVYARRRDDSNTSLSDQVEKGAKIVSPSR